MISIAVVDSGPLLAVANRADPDHEACLDVLSDSSYRLVIPAMCVAEVCYLLWRKKGPAAEARFLRGMEGVAVPAPLHAEWGRIAALVGIYADFPLGGTDAAVVSLAERLETDLIITLDHRHFRQIKPSHCNRFRLLPDGGGMESQGLP